jgi:hypothetical protein
MQTEEIEQMFQEKSDKPSRLTAPPSGLFLETVLYDDATPRKELAPVLLIDSVESVAHDKS